jgi:CRP-like cAMP-binding protein
VLIEGEVCSSFYYVLEGSFIQYSLVDDEEHIIDLHVSHEWLFNQESLTEQSPSTTTIRAYADSEVLCLSLYAFHQLSGQSQAFLQFGKILNQPKYRTFLFDQALSPTDKYNYILKSKPELTQVFPLKMIASYLKVTPETLSRVRAVI